MRTSRPLVVSVGLGLAACALTGTAATAHAASAAPASGTVYTLANAASSNELMDVYHASAAPGAPVIQYRSNNGANQEWLLTQTSSGAYTIMSANSGLCLNSAPNPQALVPQLVQNPCNGSADQRWTIQPVNDGTGTYTLVNVATGLLADDSKVSTADENPIIQWQDNGGANQHWRLTPLTRVSAFTAGLMSNGPTITGQSIRMVAHTTVAGSLARVRLSNRYGNAPLTIGAVDIAQQGSTPGAAVPGTHHTVTFNGGSTSVTIPAGQVQDVVSDPIPMAVAADSDQLVSIYVQGATNGTTWHAEANQRAWISYVNGGNHVTEDGTGNYPYTDWQSWFFLDGLDVISPTATGTVVCVGDSITDGTKSTVNSNHRWPDDLARRLGSVPGGPARSVVDAGIGSNRILTNSGGNNPPLVDRFAHDVLGQPGVKDVIMLEGINDIGNNLGSNGSTPLTAADLETGIKNVVAQAHAAGVKIFGVTIMPDKGAYTQTWQVTEPIRQAVNQWILDPGNQGGFDGVIDFATAMQAPGDPQTLNPAYDSGDHIHPNDAGYQAMANLVDLSKLTP